MVSLGSTANKRNWNGGVYHSQVPRFWRKYTLYTSRGYVGRSKQSTNTERQDMGHMHLLCLWAKCLAPPGIWAGWSIQTKKSRVLVRSRRSYLRCKEREGPGRWGTLNTRGIREFISRTYIYMWPCVWGMSLHEGLVSGSRPWRSPWPHRMDSKVPTPWRSWAKLTDVYWNQATSVLIY